MSLRVLRKFEHFSHVYPVTTTQSPWTEGDLLHGLHAKALESNTKRHSRLNVYTDKDQKRCMCVLSLKAVMHP